MVAPFSSIHCSLVSLLIYLIFACLWRWFALSYWRLCYTSTRHILHSHGTKLTSLGSLPINNPPLLPCVCRTVGSDFLGGSAMSGPSQCSSQPQFMTSVGRSNHSNGPGTPLIESIDVDQIVIPEVCYTFDSPCFILEKSKMSLSQLKFKLGC